MKSVEEGVGKEPEVVSEKVSGADEPLDMVLSTDIQRALKDCAWRGRSAEALRRIS